MLRRGAAAGGSNTIAHVHIMTEHVTRSVSYPRNSLLVLQLRSQVLPSEDAYNRIASLRKTSVHNIGSQL